MHTHRLPDWEHRLAATYTAAQARAFSWQDHHCALFTAECMQALTGVDAMAEPCNFRKPNGTLRYATEKQAYALMRKLCGGGLEQMAEQVAAHYGWPEVAPGFAQRGDMCLVQNENGEALAVVAMNGRTLWMAEEPKGVAHLERKHATRAWRVG